MEEKQWNSDDRFPSGIRFLEESGQESEMISQILDVITRRFLIDALVVDDSDDQTYLTFI